MSLLVLLDPTAAFNMVDHNIEEEEVDGTLWYHAKLIKILLDRLVVSFDNYQNQCLLPCK